MSAKQLKKLERRKKQKERAKAKMAPLRPADTVPEGESVTLFVRAFTPGPHKGY